MSLRTELSLFSSYWSFHSSICDAVHPKNKRPRVVPRHPVPGWRHASRNVKADEKTLLFSATQAFSSLVLPSTGGASLRLLRFFAGVRAWNHQSGNGEAGRNVLKRYLWEVLVQPCLFQALPVVHTEISGRVGRSEMTRYGMLRHVCTTSSSAPKNVALAT